MYGDVYGLCMANMPIKYGKETGNMAKCTAYVWQYSHLYGIVYGNSMSYDMVYGWHYVWHII
jgi:hypothetical protein